MNMLSQLPALTTLDATGNPLACAPENLPAGLLIPAAQFNSTSECAVSLVRLMLNPETSLLQICFLPTDSAGIFDLVPQDGLRALLHGSLIFWHHHLNLPTVFHLDAWPCTSDFPDRLQITCPRCVKPVPDPAPLGSGTRAGAASSSSTGGRNSCTERDSAITIAWGRSAGISSVLSAHMGPEQVLKESFASTRASSTTCRSSPKSGQLPRS